MCNLVIILSSALSILTIVVGQNADGTKRTTNLNELQNLPINVNKLIEHDFQSFVQTILNNLNVVSSNCAEDLNATIEGIKAKEPWAIAMYDASVKVPIGIEYGSVYQFGNFDQCISSERIPRKKFHKRNIRPKYCLAEIPMNDYTIRFNRSRDIMPKNNTIVNWAICVPNSCQPPDITALLSHLTSYKDIRLSDNNCYNNYLPDYNSLDIFYGYLIIMFVLIVMACSCYHMYISYIRVKPEKCDKSSTFEMILLSFSAIENLQKLVKKSENDNGLSSINGIKAISMIFVIVTHILLFNVGGPVLNANFFPEAKIYLRNSFLLNAALFVDTFFFLSGFLLSYLLLKELDKRNGKLNFMFLYICRYIRLTPAYLVIIVLYMTWLPKLGNGPLWDSLMAQEQERCQSSWWLNILYINNYVGTDKMCMFQSWYLAADTQMFMLGPLILYPLWKWKRLGLTLISGLTIVSILVPIFVTYNNHLDPTLLYYDDEFIDISTNYFFVNAYIKTHMRATPYLVGILIGYLVYFIQKRNIKISQTIIRGGWFGASLIGLLSLYSIRLYYDSPFTNIENSLYAGLNRLGWSVWIGWIVFACVLDFGGPVKRLLSIQLFAPISRLTFCAYLTNGLVELYLQGSLRAPIYMSTPNLLKEGMSHLCLTFIGAMFLSIVFESPIHGIEKILLRKDKFHKDHIKHGQNHEGA